MQFANIAAAASGNNTLVAAPGEGKRIKVHGWVAKSSNTVSVYLRSGTAGSFHFGDATNPAVLASAVVLQAPVSDNTPWFQCDDNEALVVNLSAAVAFTGMLVYSISSVDETAL